jgi:hypothetical protein
MRCQLSCFEKLLKKHILRFFCKQVETACFCRWLYSATFVTGPHSSRMRPRSIEMTAMNGCSSKQQSLRFEPVDPNHHLILTGT